MGLNRVSCRVHAGAPCGAHPALSKLYINPTMVSFRVIFYAVLASPNSPHGGGRGGADLQPAPISTAGTTPPPPPPPISLPLPLPPATAALTPTTIPSTARFKLLWASLSTELERDGIR